MEVASLSMITRSSESIRASTISRISRLDCVEKSVKSMGHCRTREDIYSPWVSILSEL
jgi:hypothetical protein